MKTFPNALIGLALAAVFASALAGPAPWYQWRSKFDGKQFCAQTSLGHGWERASGPYRDSRCEKFVDAKKSR